MFEDELLRIILSSYDDDFRKDLKKMLDKRKKNLPDAEKEEKVFMKGNSATYINPKIDEVSTILNMNESITDEHIFNSATIEKGIAEFAAKKKQFISEREKEYKDAVKKAQEAAKEYKIMKDKENTIAYVPIVCELSMSISGMIDDDLESSTNILGVFTDHKMAERQCETDINCNDDDWKELRRDLSPYGENYNVYKVYKSKYFFNRDLMVLEVKNRIILKMRLNDFSVDLLLSSSDLMDQDTYDMLLDIFNNFKADCDELLINVENNIDNLLEERDMRKYHKNKGEEECQP